MKPFIKQSLIVVCLFFFAFQASAQATKYKGMLQMSNYNGLEAYVVVSLIDAKGNAEKTLYMMGPDEKWYNGFKDWFAKLSKKKEKLNRSVTFYQLGIFALILVLVLYACVVHLFSAELFF